MARGALILLAALAAAPMALAQSAAERLAPDRADQGSRPATGALPPAARPGAATHAFKPFVLKAVDIAGSSLPPAGLQAAARPFVGQTLDAAGIQRLSDAIAQVYLTSDIALYTVLVPDQDPAAGVLKVQVLEGRIEDIHTDGAGPAQPLVQAYADRLSGPGALPRSTLQRQVSLIGDIPGLSISPALLNGSGENQADLALNSSFKPVQFAVGMDNRGTTLLGATQIQGDIYLNSLIRPGDQTRLTLASPTEGDLFRFAALTHATPFGDDGDTLQASYSALQTRPLGVALQGQAQALGLQVSQPIRRAFDDNLFLTVGLDGVNADNALFGRLLSSDRSRAARVGVAFNHTDADSVVVIAASFSQGLNALGARTLTPGASDLAFRKATLRGAYSRSLAQRLTVRLKAAGQAVSGPLPGSEQFALGGADYGRAFPAGIATGDRGYTASAELAWRPRPQDRSETYVFIDDGSTSALARPGLAAAAYHLASTGAGLRLTLSPQAVIEVEAAKGLPSATPFLDRQAWRGVVTLKSSF